jgi:glycolate oxidase iron-sulfur subunit
MASPAYELTEDQRQLLSAEYSNLLACVRCGLCLTSCPTYLLTLNEAESPRGRVGMMRALADGELELTPDLVEHELTCLVCDACSAVCPAGVHMDPLQVALRSVIDTGVRRPRAARFMRGVVFGRLFANMTLFRLVARLLWLYQRSGLQWLTRRLGVLRLLRLAETERLLPPIATRFVVPSGQAYPAATQPAQRVQLFAGCVMSTALAAVDRATIRVLQRAGCDVELPSGQGCCGALNAHSGDLDGARNLARRTISAFESDQAEPIVVNSAGCGAMLKDYAHHFRDDPTWAARARAFAARIQDVSEFLATRTVPVRNSLDATVVYQDACHLAHAQRISAQPRVLLRQIPGLKLEEMAEPGLCCGSAGVYNVTNPAESTRLRDRKVGNILATGAEIVATANPGCLFQLRSGLVRNSGGKPVEVMHIVELIDAASAP